MNMVRRMRLVALLALMMIGLMATAAGPVGATTIYADNQGRFAIGVPDGWSKQAPDDDRVVALWTTDGGAVIFNIVHADVPNGTSSLDFAKTASTDLSDYTDYMLIRKDFITCADQDCPFIDFTATDNGGETQRIHQIYVTKGSDGWILTYRTRASDTEIYNDDIQLMVYSFTI